MLLIASAGARLAVVDLARYHPDALGGEPEMVGRCVDRLVDGDRRAACGSACGGTSVSVEPSAFAQLRMDVSPSDIQSLSSRR